MKTKRQTPAQRRIAQLEQQCEVLTAIIEAANADKLLLAKLASSKRILNIADAVKARRLRDAILKEAA